MSYDLALMPHAIEQPRRALRARAPDGATRKIAFFAHLLVWATTVLFLLFVAGWTAGMIVALGWGIGLSIHGFFAIVAPVLRERWAGEANNRQVHVTVTRERGKQARSLELLSASIAHEIRNPITAAKSLVSQIGEDPASADNAEYARVAVEELDRVERAITHLLRYAREETPRIEEVPLIELVDSAMETLRDRIDKSGAIVTRSVDRDVVVRVDPEQMRRVVMNLVTNALEAFDSQTDTLVEIEGGASLAGDEVWLRVRDNGPGIADHALDTIFEPFRTTKSKGTGLGLPIARKIVEAHGGTIVARSTPGRTELEITLKGVRA